MKTNLAVSIGWLTTCSERSGLPGKPPCTGFSSTLLDPIRWVAPSPNFAGRLRWMGTDRRPSIWARRVVISLTAAVTLLSACSGDTNDVTDVTTATSATTAPPPTLSTTVSVTNTTTTAPTASSLTTEPFPSREVLVYFEDLQALTVRIGELVVDMRAANNDWDNRSVTGVSYADTEARLEDIERRALALRDDIGLLEPPPDRGLPVEHQTAWVAVGQMADAAVDALSGLRSTDTGERRRAALTEFLVAYDRYTAAFGRIVEIIGVAAGVTLPTIPSTTAPATTTTSTTQATTTTTALTAATTSTTEAPSTSTTEAPSTSTTEAPSTSTTEAPGTGTVPPAPDIGYSVLTEELSPFQGAERTWLTVQVDAGATMSELGQIGNRLAFEYRVAQQYQALLIYFVHFPEGVDTLGTWIHAPFGDWNRAAEVTKGDYSQHRVDDRTVEKDWTSLPTDSEVDLYRKYREYKGNLSDSPDPVPPDEELIPLAAEEFQVPAEDLRGAIAAWEAWEAK